MHKSIEGKSREGHPGSITKRSSDGMSAELLSSHSTILITLQDIFAFSTAVVPGVMSRTVKDRIPRTVSDVFSRQMQEVQEIPVYDHVCPGWDHSNMRWLKQPVWPKLDRNLIPTQDETKAVWKLDWKRNPEGATTVETRLSGERAEATETNT